MGGGMNTRPVLGARPSVSKMAPGNVHEVHPCTSPSGPHPLSFLRCKFAPANLLSNHVRDSHPAFRHRYKKSPAEWRGLYLYGARTPDKATWSGFEYRSKATIARRVEAKDGFHNRTKFDGANAECSPHPWGSAFGPPAASKIAPGNFVEPHPLALIQHPSTYKKAPALSFHWYNRR